MAKKAYIGVGGVARKVKKGYIGIHQVPQKQYAILNYIRGTGTQYITTGTPINESYTVEMKANIQQVTGSLYGLIGNWGTMSCTLYGDEFRFLWYSSCSDWSPTLNTDYVIKHTPSAVYINGSALSKSSDTNSGSGNFSVLNANKGIGKAFVYYFRVYASDGTTLIANYLPCKRISDGAIGLYDKVGKRFYINNGTGTFTAGAETGEYIYDVPQEGDYARKIKRAYIGVGGVARPFWSGGELTYYGTATPLSAGRIGGGTANAGTYLLAAGGAQYFTVGATHFATVDVYDAYLTRTTAADRSVRGYNTHPNCGGASAGEAYALFAGGYNAPSYTSYDNVDAYSQNLTKTAAPSLGSALNNLSGFTLGNKGFFGHGTTYVYDTNLTRSAVTGLAGANRFNSATVGGYGVLTGDETTNAVAYNESMTRTALTKSQYGGSGCAGAGYALFARESYAYAYTPDLTLVTLTPLSVSRWGANTAYLDGFSLFAGGDDMSVVDAYQGLTRVVTANLSSKRTNAFSGTVGNYALFCGGLNSGTVVSTTDVFTVA